MLVLRLVGCGAGADGGFSRDSSSTALTLSVSSISSEDRASGSDLLRVSHRACACLFLRIPLGRTAKNAISMTSGKNAEADSAPRGENPQPVVATAYAPAPTNPAAPVPLPQPARLKGP